MGADIKPCPRCGACISRSDSICERCRRGRTVCIDLDAPLRERIRAACPEFDHAQVDAKAWLPLWRWKNGVRVSRFPDPGDPANPWHAQASITPSRPLPVWARGASEMAAVEALQAKIGEDS